MSMLKEGQDYFVAYGNLTIAWVPCYRAYCATNEFFGLAPMAEAELLAMLKRTPAFNCMAVLDAEEALSFSIDKLPTNMRVMLIGK
jgi:hypothetical protein